jgi:hypothetical protein
LRVRVVSVEPRDETGLDEAVSDDDGAFAIKVRPSRRT